jgi:hypothetical protein
MKKSLLVLPALLLAAAPLPAHADPTTAVRTGFVLQGSVAYDCYGCGDTATFAGIATFARENGFVNVPTTGDLYVNESCGDSGSFGGTLHVGADDYEVSVSRSTAAITIISTGPGGFYDAYVGAGTLTNDAPAGTCGVPVNATLTAEFAPFVNCYCQVATDPTR